ncbi:hypothetical protein L2E82_48572 [Cichorium intybus]|uniref:Uncharacterized protein n=1 Tax=Cichorium intybus TaxID=13427 RepID=A0ACB8YZN3_CICIN|nr:hypothetical protein L2E82_48572 [Cichorium intybus]
MHCNIDMRIESRNGEAYVKIFDRNRGRGSCVSDVDDNIGGTLTRGKKEGIQGQGEKGVGEWKSILKNEMDMSNWRHTRGGIGCVGESSIESGDWRAQLQANSRERMVNRIMDAMKIHNQVSGDEGLQKLVKIAVSFEDKIFIAATSESDYMRKICFKILTIETRSQNPIPDANNVNLSDAQSPMPDAKSVNPLDPVIGDSSLEFGDWRVRLQADSRKRIVDKLMDTLKRHIPYSGHELLQELEKIAVVFEDKIYTAATSLNDYLRKISLKILTMETRSQNHMPGVMQ